MIYSVKNGTRSGEVTIPSSKSYAHRFLICAALSDKESIVKCDGISKDIEATIKCLNALGADITLGDNNCIFVKPLITVKKGRCNLYCGESGSTLRFLIPVVGALGADAVFYMEGKLYQRPLDALTKTLTQNGMKIEQDGTLLYCSGKLTSGTYRIPGNISSQYISGMLFALPLIEGNSTLEVFGNIESADYIIMTEDAISATGISFIKEANNYSVSGNQKYSVNENAVVERDWSNAAFFLCMGAVSKNGITLQDMNLSSRQGDKEIINIIKKFGADVIINDNSVTVKRGTLKGQVIDAKAIPDLIPTICALACASDGKTEIINAERLRLKESDRIATTAAMLRALGAVVTEKNDGIIIEGTDSLNGGKIDAANDHRIAMSAAVAASICENEVIINGAQCVSKSYPDFWEHLEKLEVEI